MTGITPQKTIKVATDFSTTPGTRRKQEGPFSGEVFRSEYLLPAVKEAISNGTHVLVDLDGVEGYGSSFLEEIFAGMIRENNIPLSELTRVLQIKSVEQPELKDVVFRYMAIAESKRK